MSVSRDANILIEAARSRVALAQKELTAASEHLKILVSPGAQCSVSELSVGVGTTNKQEAADVDGDSSEEDACVLVKVIPAPVRRTRRGKRKLDITTSAEAGQEKNQDTKMLLCQPVTPECGIPKKKYTIKPDKSNIDQGMTEDNYEGDHLQSNHFPAKAKEVVCQNKVTTPSSLPCKKPKLVKTFASVDIANVNVPRSRKQSSSVGKTDSQAGNEGTSTRNKEVNIEDIPTAVVTPRVHSRRSAARKAASQISQSVNEWTNQESGADSDTYQFKKDGDGISSDDTSSDEEELEYDSDDSDSALKRAREKQCQTLKIFATLKKEAVLNKKQRVPGQVKEKREESNRAGESSPLCLVHACDRRAAGSGLCLKHGDGDKEEIRRCNVEGCKNIARGTGKCFPHGGTQVPKKCKFNNCNNQVVNSGVCRSHGARVRKCTFEGCTKDVQKAGRCYSHGAKRAKCTYIGCDRNAYIKGGVCNIHADIKRCTIEGCKKLPEKGGVRCSHKASTRKKLCDVTGCCSQAKIDSLCKRHYKKQSEQGFASIHGPSPTNNETEEVGGGCVVS